MRRMFLLLAFAATALCIFSEFAQAALIDLGGGLIHDNDYDLIWLQDANYAQTSGYDADGLLSWDEAMTWAQNLVYGGYDDWRLPSPLNQDDSGPCLGNNCIESEMGHLYYTELGNIAGGPLTNVGNFLNLMSGTYWSNMEGPLSTAWGFHFDNGAQGAYHKFPTYAMAVRESDTTGRTIPEPTTLSIFGLGLMGLFSRRRT